MPIVARANGDAPRDRASALDAAPDAAAGVAGLTLSLHKSSWCLTFSGTVITWA